MNHYRTLIFIKPDALERNIESILIKRILDSFPLVHIKDVVITEELCDQHYVEHLNKPFYSGLKEAMVGKKVIALEVLSITEYGDHQSSLGARKECEQIRKEYVDTQYIGPRNIIHCSDSIEAGKIECDLWFGKTVESLTTNLPKKKSGVRLASKIADKDAFLERLDDELMERGTKLEKDLEKVLFDFENCSYTANEFPVYGDLLGYNKIGDFEFVGVASGGDWEFPVFFLVYLDKDGKTLRGFIPKEGNAWNYDTKQALGNAEDDEDSKFLIKALKLKDDDAIDVEADDYADQLVNIPLLKETIASRFEVV